MCVRALSEYKQNMVCLSWMMTGWHIDDAYVVKSFPNTFPARTLHLRLFDPFYTASYAFPPPPPLPQNPK